MNKLIRNLLIPPGTSIRETMNTITTASHEGAPAGIALIVDGQERLLGIVTDGDIRRALVKNIPIDSKVGDIMVPNPITVPKGLSEMEMLGMVSQKVVASNRIIGSKVNQVIVVDEQNRVDDVIDFLDLWKSLNIRERSVCVFGLGFVGLTLGVTLADVGFKVYGYDIKESLINDINRGIAPFYEKGLAPLLKFHVSKGGFKAVSEIQKGMADVYIITVGTPIDDGLKPDLSDLRATAQSVAKCLKERDLVLLRSTVPAGTTREFVIPLLEAGSGLKAGEDFFVAFAPERTVEGRALEELWSLPQVIGGFNQRSLELAVSFFSQLNQTIVRVSSLEAAEMIKLANNTFRDLSFAFANEMAMVCDGYGLDVREIIEAANKGYPRNPIPAPSPGVGGICLKKDPFLYAETAKARKVDARLALASRHINEGMPGHVFRKIESFLGKNKPASNGPVKIFLIGFAFKGEPETSDMRVSPTLDVVRLIKGNTRWEIFGYDPLIPRDEIERLEIKAVSLQEGFKNADCVAIMNNHRSYRDLDILGLAQTMRQPALFFDGWHLFPKGEFQRLPGITYGGLSGAD